MLGVAMQRMMLSSSQAIRSDGIGLPNSQITSEFRLRTEGDVENDPGSFCEL